MNMPVKKLVSILLSLALVLALGLEACADGGSIDLSALESAEIFDVDIDEEGDFAFITTTLDTESRSFAHDLESEHYYSSTQFDVVVPRYSGDAYPVLRLWVEYIADAYNNNRSVLFEFGGKGYLFSDVLDEDLTYELENGVVEDLRIIFGLDNVDFLLDLLDYLDDYDDDVEMLDQVDITMTLCGDEFLEVSLGAGFAMDFLAMMSAFTDIGGPDYMHIPHATSMTVA